MKITKFEHACLLLEENGKKLVIDPGSLVSRLPTDLSVEAIVLTHIHGDHMDPGHIRQLVATNPDLVIYADAAALEALQEIDAKKVLAKGGQTEQVGGFNLEFFGHDHAVVFEVVPCENVGVMVNHSLYYPGDSYTKPNKPVKTLALPISGPWLKIGDALQFMIDVKPQEIFSTHDSLLSEDGLTFTLGWVDRIADRESIGHFHLAAGESYQ